MLGKRSYSFFGDIGTRRCSIDDKTERLFGLFHHLHHHSHGAQVVRARTRGDKNKISSSVRRFDGVHGLWGRVDQDEIDTLTA